MKNIYTTLARQAIHHYLASIPYTDLIIETEDSKELWQSRKACFVSIKNHQGSLRGCMGSILPIQKNLGLEVMTNAITSATQDPRFAPVSMQELNNLNISVDVLSYPEVVESIKDLDPKKWGVIVSLDGKKGVLLPDLEGITSVEQQLSIAAQKGGINDWKTAKIERFSVTRYHEVE